MLRTYRGGHVKLSEEQRFPFDPPRMKLDDDPDLASVTSNWWVGLAMLHTLFMREHNAICDHLAKAHPCWSDEQLYDTARLVNAALIAKIHTLEWTTALLAHPNTELGMRVNWWGFEGEHLDKWFGRWTKDEEVRGLPGSDLYYHDAPFAMTEEFVSVYRMHALIPDDVPIRAVADDHLIETFPFAEIAGTYTQEVLDDKRITMEDLFYSFATTNPGALVLHNYPNPLREFSHADGTIDVATIDILRDRERGVPRYNQFRRRFRLPPLTRFEDFSDDPAVVADLRRIYGNPEQVDLMVGLYAEKRPEGFAISETAFRVFILMASRRLKSDRFFTYDYRPEVYTKEGLRWIEYNTLSSVLRRHYPTLGPALRDVENVFKPWDTTTNRRTASRWRWRRRFWNALTSFKFVVAKPLRVPVPKDRTPVIPVPFTRKFPDIPIAGLVVADRFPADEFNRLVFTFVRFEEWLSRAFSLARPGLPPIDEDPEAALAAAYPAVNRRLYRSPTRPPRVHAGRRPRAPRGREPLRVLPQPER